MQYASFLTDVEFSEDKPVITPLMEGIFSKEIRIAMKKGQSMKAHKTAYPISVMVVSGQVDFGSLQTRVIADCGDVIALEGGITHDLIAMKDSVVRLSLHKNDSVTRVNAVLKL